MVVPAGQVLPVPPGVSLRDAASLPEVACTVWSTVFMMSKLSKGESFLVCVHMCTQSSEYLICVWLGETNNNMFQVHGGSSGIGTFAVQIAKHHGVKVFVTAGLL